MDGSVPHTLNSFHRPLRYVSGVRNNSLAKFICIAKFIYDGACGYLWPSSEQNPNLAISIIQIQLITVRWKDTYTSCPRCCWVSPSMFIVMQSKQAIPCFPPISLIFNTSTFSQTFASKEPYVSRCLFLFFFLRAHSRHTAINHCDLKNDTSVAFFFCDTDDDGLAWHTMSSPSFFYGLVLREESVNKNAFPVAN